MEALEQTRDRLAVGIDPAVDADEFAARRSLRAQVARLERELAACGVTARGSGPLEVAARCTGGPRLLSLGELEVLRDDLCAALGRAQAGLAERARRQESSRVLLERMRLDPPSHKYVRVTNADLGEPGCTSWHVRPRLGIIGMMMGWWQVKLSSGCPLATRTPPRASAPRRRRVPH